MLLRGVIVSALIYVAVATFVAAIVAANGFPFLLVCAGCVLALAAILEGPR